MGCVPDSAIINPLSWTDTLDLSLHFDTTHPLEVDIGCGKGRFLVARAGAMPETNFLGVDRLLRRLRKVDKKIRRDQLANVRLLRIEALYAVHHLLPARSVSTVYVFFPDPWPKRRHHPRRLFSPLFLDALDRAMVPGGCIHIATDHSGYFEAIVRLFNGDKRFGEAPAFEPNEEERTEFEAIFLAQSALIGRACYSKVGVARDISVRSAG